MTSASSTVLAPLGALYGAAIALRRALYHTGLLHVHKLDAPIISVGNITTGGTGKTPLVDLIARIVADEGKRVCILTRGYGRKEPGQRVVVSDGKTLLADARTAGDEPFLLAESLLGLSAVISDADRAAAARWATTNLASDVFILDDGFQHLATARDLNILVIDATNPFGSGHLLPRGRLREPLSAIRRADCIVITRADQVPEIESLTEELRKWCPATPILSSKIATRGLTPLSGTQPADVEAAQPVGVFCGIGNPESFFKHLELNGTAICYQRAFADHHNYQQQEIDEVISAARARGAQTLLTTQKDAVKLRGLSFDLPCYVVEIELVMKEEPEFRRLIRSAISAQPKQN